MIASQTYFVPWWGHWIAACISSRTVLQLPISQRFSKCFIWGSGTVHVIRCSLFLVTEAQWTAEIKLYMNRRGRTENHNQPNQQVSILNPKSRRPFYTHLVATLRWQLHPGMLSYSDTYCLMRQFLAMASCISTQMVAQEEARWEGRRNHTDGQTFSFAILSHRERLRNVFLQYRLSLMTGLICGDLANGQYQLLSNPFRLVSWCKMQPIVLKHINETHAVSSL